MEHIKLFKALEIKRDQMERDNKQNEQVPVSLSDCWRLCKRYKRQIFLATGLLALAGAVIALAKPIEYQVEGTFREKSPKSANVNSSLIDLIITGNMSHSLENEAVSILKSQKIIHPVINKMNLQATIARKQDLDSFFNRIKSHSIVEYFLLSRKEYPGLADPHCPLQVDSIVYNLEKPLSFKVVFPDDDQHYHLLGLDDRVVGSGEINIPYLSEELQFTLKCAHQQLDNRSIYVLSFWPLHLMTAKMKKKLQIESDINDKNLLKITFKHRDRHLAAQFINTLMVSYQDYLKKDHDRQAALQLGYLKEKRGETKQHLEELMSKHAAALSEELSSSGFADSGKEMEFMAQSQHEFKERLIFNELEIKRLQNVQMGKCVYYDQYSRNAGDHNIINSVLKEIRELQQQRDALALALKKSHLLNPENLKLAFQQQHAELAEVQLHLREIDEILHAFQYGADLNRASRLYNDPGFLVKAWHQRMEGQKGNRQEYEAQFHAYLYNLKRLFSVHEKIIKERLTHQQDPSFEYQGIHLNTAQELYLDYSKRLNDLEAKKRENAFLIHQMQDPNFEITSLSTVLSDSVSSEMIQKASHLLLELKDQNNRSDKEQMQLKEELNLERGFLLMHLQQTNQLLLLNQQLVEEKIFSLQNMTLELIHQQISVLEKNLHDYIETRLENLKQERFIIEQQMDQLHQEMAALPKRWANEKLLQQNLEINELMVQEVAKMVESKNISHQLELIQSAPLDAAIAPIHPLSSGVILYSVLGALIGGLLSFSAILGKSLSNGIIASTANLKLMGQHVSGPLSSVENANLETLRRLQSFMSDHQLADGEQSLLLIEGRGPDYSADLADLFIKKGKKVVRLFLVFDRPAESDQPGLLQYLEGQVSFPVIHRHPLGDYIESGGVTSFSNELLTRDLFSALLMKLKEDYDWIIAVSPALPSSAEAESLTALFPLVAVTIFDETLQQLDPYLKYAADPNKKVTFMMAAEDDIG
ncbi:MAG: hypothetical protein ACHQUC_00785 [Chlamydiales bacterium]